MPKLNRTPLDKQNVIPHFKILTLIPIIVFFLLVIWFWGNDLAIYICVIGLAVVEMAFVLVDGLLRRRRGGRFDRGDIMLIGAGVIAIVYVVYLIITAQKTA